MNELPRTTVGGISMPRMLIGTNWLLGYSHTGAEQLVNKNLAALERRAPKLEARSSPFAQKILGRK